MDIQQHKKEMEELHALAQLAKDNPKLDVSALVPDSFRMIPAGGEEEAFPWRKYFNRVAFINENIDTIVTSEDKKLVTKFKKQRKELLELFKHLPINVESKEDYLKLINNFPRGFTWAESDRFVELVSCSEHTVESSEIWRVETFNDAFYDIKECILLEFSAVEGENVCHFSFTDKVLDISHDFQSITDDMEPLDILDKFDVNNILFMIRVYDNDTWIIPAHFESLMSRSIAETSYSFSDYDDKGESFVNSCKELGLNELAEFIEAYRNANS